MLLFVYQLKICQVHGFFKFMVSCYHGEVLLHMVPARDKKSSHLTRDHRDWSPRDHLLNWQNIWDAVCTKWGESFICKSGEWQSYFYALFFPTLFSSLCFTPVVSCVFPCCWDLVISFYILCSCINNIAPETLWPPIHHGNVFVLLHKHVLSYLMYQLESKSVVLGSIWVHHWGNYM